MTADCINWPRIKRILDECPPVDGYRGYYRQFDVPHRRLSPLVPKTRDLLRGALRPEMRVLDIGCGRGDTLLACAPLFARGEGIDESAEVMIAAAEQERARRGISNVHFHVAKGAALPFADESFDLAFSERGPMGHQDVTLREALRVLRPGALFFIELTGEWNSWETRTAFEPEYVRPPSPLGLLNAERERLERHGVRVHTLASRLETLEFASLEDWLRYQLYTWSPPGREAITEENMAAIRRLHAIASSGDDAIRVTVHTLWFGGTKGEAAAG